MASSGTYAFAPTNADLVLGAFGRIQIRPSAIVTEHLTQAARQANLLMAEMNNRQPNLWASENQDITLVLSTKTYTLPVNTIMISTAVLRTNDGDDDQNDRVIWPVSTSEYWSYPNKLTEGVPNVYWFDRQIIPQITFWPVPDASSTYIVKAQYLRQLQDVNLASGETPNLPNRWFDVFEAGLAYRLSRFYAPQLEQLRGQDYEKAWAVSATQDTENTAMYLTPMVSAYRV
jgi:hypothetical protein